MPESASATPPIEAPRDVPSAGTDKVAVDATDLDRKIWNVTTTMPVSKAGDFVFLYPQWVPGGHSPRNDLDKLAGLLVTANGKRIPWTRDVVSVNAFHVDVPAGVTELSISYQFLTAVEAKVGRTEVTPEMLNLQWLQVTMYPAGYYTRQIPIEASVKLPEGWKLATALDTASTAGQSQGPPGHDQRRDPRSGRAQQGRRRQREQNRFHHSPYNIKIYAYLYVISETLVNRASRLHRRRFVSVRKRTTLRVPMFCMRRRTCPRQAQVNGTNIPASLPREGARAPHWGVS
jgi:hypothetical protein